MLHSSLKNDKICFVYKDPELEDTTDYYVQYYTIDYVREELKGDLRNILLVSDYSDFIADARLMESKGIMHEPLDFHIPEVLLPFIKIL